MLRRSLIPSLSLIALMAGVVAPVSGLAAARHGSHGHASSWGATQRAAANEMIAELDMTSFPNSIGPRREAGKRTLAQYGFTTRTSFDDGWAYAKMADGSWEVGIFVLANGRHQKRLCVTDSAVGGGTYHATTALDVRRMADGLWTSVHVLPPVHGCS